MRGRWTALGLALMLSLTLTSCGVRTGTAGTDGAVKRRSAGETEWEKLGRELRESWDKMMDGAEDAAQNTERAAENAVRGTERAAKDAVRDVEHGV